MKKTINLFFLLLFASFSVDSTLQKKSYEDNHMKCNFYVTQGRLNGKYVSYYKNGKKKSEGQFENNCRIGKWSVWDSTGLLRVQRNYENMYMFKTIFPEAQNNKQANAYTIQYNKEGYIVYSPLTEKMVVWSNRIWRTLSAKENPIIFENNKLFDVIYKNVLNKNITAYSPVDDEFTKALEHVNIDTKTIEVVGFKIKEECFFDTSKMLAETRIIGICPEVVNKINHETTDLYWIYYPEIRQYLAKEKIYRKGMPAKINTIDDLFFFRHFYGVIYKESNVYNRKISDYKKGDYISKEAEAIDIRLIELEHDTWINAVE